MKGILNFNKLSGMTSSDVVVKVRKTLHEKAVGHMGTLDPQGEGVLLIGVGKATRLFDYYLKKDKIYEAEFTFGLETDTLDGDGTTLITSDKIPIIEEIENVLPQFIGKQSQLPPRYSAKSINGKRAYDMARNGEEFTLAPSEIEIFNIQLLRQTKENAFTFRIHCSSGTYIRSICHDLAYKLNTVAIMTAIRRTKCGPFKIEDSVSLDNLTQNGESCLISIEDALSSVKRVDFNDEDFNKICNGVKIPFDFCDDYVKVYCKNEFFGLGKSINGMLKIITYLRD